MERVETHTWMNNIPWCPLCHGMNHRIDSFTKDEITGQCKCGCNWKTYNHFRYMTKKELENNISENKRRK
jgi:hypothetical protein